MADVFDLRLKKETHPYPKFAYINPSGNATWEKFKLQITVLKLVIFS